MTAIGKAKLFALFDGEGEPQFYDPAYKHNEKWAVKGPYQTDLSSPEEHQFREYLQNHPDVYFDPNAKRVDYDMRGFWQSMIRGHHHSGTNFFYPDKWKTPYDTSFSNDSQYAKEGTPLEWQHTNIGEGDLVNTNTGRVIVDHRDINAIQTDDDHGPQETRMINPKHQELYDAARKRVMKAKRPGFAQPPRPTPKQSNFRKQQSY